MRTTIPVGHRSASSSALHAGCCRPFFLRGKERLSGSGLHLPACLARAPLSPSEIVPVVAAAAALDWGSEGGAASPGPLTDVYGEALGVLQVAEYLVGREGDALVQAAADAASPAPLRHFGRIDPLCARPSSLGMQIYAHMFCMLI